VRIRTTLACAFFTVDTVLLRRLYALVFILGSKPPDRVRRVYERP
jgi:hypothetical protein